MLRFQELCLALLDLLMVLRHLILHLSDRLHQLTIFEPEVLYCFMLLFQLLLQLFILFRSLAQLTLQ